MNKNVKRGDNIICISIEHNYTDLQLNGIYKVSSFDQNSKYIGIYINSYIEYFPIIYFDLITVERNKTIDGILD